MTLRRQLVATMIVLVTLGLVAVDVITLSSLRSYLFGRVDVQLNVAHEQVETFVLRADARGLPVTADTIQGRVSPDIYVEILSVRGTVVTARPSGTKAQSDPPPRLPSPLPIRTTGSTDLVVKPHGSYRPDANSVNVTSDPLRGPDYRLQASAIPGGTLVVATRLDAVNATLVSLRDIELAVSASVVAALLILMTLIFRRGLRPLEEMTEEADAIAAGDLTRRIRVTSAESEIGRLSRALNGMLSQIEAAFAQRTMSEDRLRQFLADASHELRTPLTTIRGYAELLRKDALPDDVAREQALVRIEREAVRMGDLVGDLLTIARLGEEQEPAPLEIDLVKVVTDAVTDARAVNGNRSISLVATEPVWVAGDEPRLGQIIHNLIGNALAHTPPRTPVEVQVSAHDDRAVLRVQDRGPGMDAEQASRIFDRFYRGDASPSNGGSGLGLFIVAAVARALRGRVTVDTALGRGSTFEVVLPLYGTDPADDRVSDN
jgi:two-component system, OmpR family, sensor kinase